MGIVVKFLYDFVLLTLLIYIIYVVFVNKNKKKYSDLKNNDFIKIFIKRYDINLKKINYIKIMRIVSLLKAIIISFSSTAVLNVNGFGYKILIAFISVFTLSYSLFEIVGKYLKKKGGK